MRISVFVKRFLGARTVQSVVPAAESACLSGRIKLQRPPSPPPRGVCPSVSAQPLDHLCWQPMGPDGFNFTLLLPLTAEDVFRGPQWMPETTDRNGS